MVSLFSKSNDCTGNKLVMGLTGRNCPFKWVNVVDLGVRCYFSTFLRKSGESESPGYLYLKKQMYLFLNFMSI